MKELMVYKPIQLKTRERFGSFVHTLHNELEINWPLTLSCCHYGQRSEFRLAVSPISRSEHELSASFTASRQILHPQYTSTHHLFNGECIIIELWPLTETNFMYSDIQAIANCFLLSCWQKLLTGKDQLIPIHTMKAYGWMVHITCQPVYPLMH